MDRALTQFPITALTWYAESWVMILLHTSKAAILIEGDRLGGGNADIVMVFRFDPVGIQNLVNLMARSGYDDHIDAVLLQQGQVFDQNGKIVRDS